MRRERLSVLAGLAVLVAGAAVFASSVGAPPSSADPSIASTLPLTTSASTVAETSDGTIPGVSPAVEAALFRSGHAAVARPGDLKGLPPAVRRTLIANDTTLRVALPSESDGR